MARAIITVILVDVTDEEALALKKQVTELVKDRKGTQVALNVQG